MDYGQNRLGMMQEEQAKNIRLGRDCQTFARG